MLSSGAARAAEAPAAAVAPAAATPASSPRILFGGVPLPVPSPEKAPFRDASGDLCVAPESLAPLGIAYVADDESGMVTLAGPDGFRTVTVKERHARGVADDDKDAPIFVPVVDVVEGLGGKCEWSAATATLYAHAVLLSAEMIGGQVRIHATLPIKPVVRIDKDGRIVVIDVPGAEVGHLAQRLSFPDPSVSRARAGQFEDDTARLVLEMRTPGAFALLGSRASMDVVLNPADPKLAASLPTEAGTANVAAATTSAGTAAPAAPTTADAVTRAANAVAVASGKPAKPVPISRVTGVSFRRVSDDRAQFVISADRAPAVKAGLDNGRLTLDLMNASIIGDPSALIDKFDHPFIKGAQLVPNGQNAARLILDLTRSVAYTLRATGPGKLLLELALPRGVNGKLSGKTIVVDAGHGAHDSGATGFGHAEKNVTLAIATQLAQDLRDLGATVILTRNDDTFIPVDQRPVVANQAGADFFVSVHADSADRNHAISGSTVYFHMDWAPCRTLARTIADRLADSGSGIPSRGTHSDAMKYGGRFVNGYGVLRGSAMVAVLVECGYMSNARDVAKLNDAGQQKKIAAAIADGLRDYVEDNPGFDTRFINPQPFGSIGSTSGGFVPAPLDGVGATPDPNAPPPAAPDGSAPAASGPASPSITDGSGGGNAPAITGGTNSGNGDTNGSDGGPGKVTP